MSLTAQIADEKKLIRRTLASRILEAREEAGLTQSELADAIGAAGAMIVSRWERGEVAPEYGNLAGLAVALGKPAYWFFR